MSEERREENILHKQYNIGFFSLFILAVSITLAFIRVVLIDNSHQINIWNILLLLVFLTPLIYMIKIDEVKNRYIKWMIPVILILIFDLFYYNNDFTQYFLPYIIFFFIMVLYLTSMHSVESFYQIFIPSMAIPFKIFPYIKMFLSKLLVHKEHKVHKSEHKSIYRRIGISLVITLPVLIVFILLFMSADENFNNFIKNIFAFDIIFTVEYIFWMPIYLIVFLLFFIYSFSNTKTRVSVNNQKTFDKIIIGIFLSMINLLFILFLLFQINYLFGGEEYIKISGINIANFAREGFFQLMWVMGIVVTIFLIIMSRFKGEKVVIFLLSGLIFLTIVIGFSSLKKMYLYQSIKGATVLRYYIEWFDYFLLSLLTVGIIFIIMKKPFYQLLNTIFVIGIISLTIVSSLNIDATVASYNIEKFKNNPSQLDTYYLTGLSIDALPEIQNSEIILKVDYYRDCNRLNDYHFGYCTKLDIYGSSKIK